MLGWSQYKLHWPMSGFLELTKPVALKTIIHSGFVLISALVGLLSFYDGEA